MTCPNCEEMKRQRDTALSDKDAYIARKISLQPIPASGTVYLTTGLVPINPTISWRKPADHELI